MASNNVEFRVGVVVLLGLAVIVASLYWLQGYRLSSQSRTIKVMFDDVGTLSIGDNVTVSGVRRGKVNHLELTPDGVVVELQVSRDVVLKRDAQIVIKNMGLMGERFIAITPGKDSLAFDYGATAIGLYDTGLPEVMGLMGEMISELRNLVGAFKRTVGSDSSLQRFNETVNNFERMSASLADYVERNQGKLDRTADNFLDASHKLNTLLADNSARVDSALQSVERTSTQVEAIVGQLDTVAAAAREFAENINRPDGTLQLLLEDRRLYDDLRHTADNIDSLINDIRANPRKYINLTVEIF